MYFRNCHILIYDLIFFCFSVFFFCRENFLTKHLNPSSHMICYRSPSQRYKKICFYRWSVLLADCLHICHGVWRLTYIDWEGHSCFGKQIGYDSSRIGPNAPAVLCLPTIGIEPVQSPISELMCISFARPLYIFSKKDSITKTSDLYRRTLQKYPARYLSLSHLMAYYFILIPGTVIRTFLIVAAHKTVVLVFIQVDIAVIFVAFFIVSIICAEFTAGSLHCLPLLFDSFFVITVLNYTTI